MAAPDGMRPRVRRRPGCRVLASPAARRGGTGPASVSRHTSRSPSRRPWFARQAGNWSAGSGTGSSDPAERPAYRAKEVRRRGGARCPRQRGSRSPLSAPVDIDVNCNQFCIAWRSGRVVDGIETREFVPITRQRPSLGLPLLDCDAEMFVRRPGACSWTGAANRAWLLLLLARQGERATRDRPGACSSSQQRK
jgi:hypothetical protein